MSVIRAGSGDYLPPDPDGVREWMRDNKPREPVEKVMDEREAVRRFVHDGDYVSYDLSSMVRGPMSLEREIVRQGKRRLWLAAKFTLLDSTLLVAGGCVDRIDVGFAGLGKTLFDSIKTGEVRTVEWSNGTLVLRHLAGAMGIPFIPTRALLGTDTLERSGAKVITDPFTGKRVCIVPAVNPDVAIIHVNQCDALGNARIFGPSVAPLETALASRKVIISTEEVIPTEEIRRRPGLTTIPYYLVNAVIPARFGAHPGTVPGYYTYDGEHLAEFFAVRGREDMEAYLERYIHSVSSHREYLAKVGEDRLERLVERETIREGYHP